MKWTKDSWKKFEAKQMPAYADQNKLDSVIKELSSMPPLIFAGETRSLNLKYVKSKKVSLFIYKVVTVLKVSKN